MTLKKKIGIPCAVAFFCLSKLLSEMYPLSGIFLLLSIICFSVAVSDEYLAAKWFYKILVGISVGTMFFIALLLSTPLADAAVSFEWGFIILGLMLVPIGLVVLIRIGYDIKLYYDIKHFDD